MPLKKEIVNLYSKYRYMIQSVKVNNSEMEYIKFGDGNKIFVIIPGLSLKSVLLSEEAIIASFSGFTSEFTVYLFDRIKDIPKNYNIHNMVEDAYSAMINAWIKSCNIFWASQWWMIAQCIAIKYPDFVEKMILWNSTCKIESNALKIISGRIELAKLGKISELNKKFLTDVYCEETIKKYWDSLLQSNENITSKEIKRFIKLASTILDFDIKKDLVKVKCKTLVIGSNNDSIFGWESAKLLAKELNSELYLYDTFGHAVYDEAPDFRDRMLRFLQN